jgi:pantoate--beta-alanine ligase
VQNYKKFITISHMFLFKKIQDLHFFLKIQEKADFSVGFVPTMGALHQGHLSLIFRSKAENHITVCSIFVNPTQFNDKADLEKYPRPIEHDIELLTSAGCDVLFLPSVEEMYPPDFDYSYNPDLGGIELPYEGASRPGHFKGVVQVVRRLLQIVEPQKLYMGQKDYQQYLVCKKMIQLNALPVEIVRCEIARETDGLAMSSRNVRLSPEARQLAPIIYQTLLKTKEMSASHTPAEVVAFAKKELSVQGCELDYFDLACADTLQPIAAFDKNAVAVTTVKIGGVRLLDNILI